MIISTVREIDSLPDNKDYEFEISPFSIEFIAQIYQKFALRVHSCQVALNIPPLNPQLTAVGGTFDHLHEGHKLLLSIAAIHASKLIVGVNIKTEHKKGTLQTYNHRVSILEDFLKKVRSDLAFEICPISDVYGPSVEIKELKKLVVTEETKFGGEKSKFS